VTILATAGVKIALGQKLEKYIFPLSSTFPAYLGWNNICMLEQRNLLQSGKTVKNVKICKQFNWLEKLKVRPTQS